MDREYSAAANTDANSSDVTQPGAKQTSSKKPQTPRDRDHASCKRQLRHRRPKHDKGGATSSCQPVSEVD